MAKNVGDSRSGEAGAATAKRGWARGIIKGVIAVSLFIVFSGLIVYAYNKGKEAGGGDTPPIIKAGPAPYKVRPDRPGGMQVLNRDKRVYSQIEGGAKPPVVERLLPPAEKPIAPIAAAPPPPLPRPPLAAPKSSPPTAKTSPAPLKIAKPAPVKLTKPTASRPKAKPAAATARRLSTVAPASGGDYKIQLASLRSTDAVKRSWKRLVGSNKDLLGRLRMTVVRRDLGKGKGVYYRMQAGPLPDAGAARDLCGRLKRRKLSCLVVRP
jgi:cell division septation protein DedD